MDLQFAVSPSAFSYTRYFLVELRAHRKDAGVDPSVVLERPPELSLADPELLSALVHVRIHERAQARVLADVAPLLADPQKNEARRLRAAHLEAPEELRQAERKDLPAHVPYELVQVGHRHGDRGRLSADRHDARDLRQDEELVVRRHLLGLGRGKGHEAPVFAPAVVEDVDEERDVLVEVLERQGAGGDFGPGLHFIEGALHALVRLAHRVLPRVEVLDLCVPGLLDEASLVARVVRHGDVGRGVEAFDEAADFLVHVEREGPAGALHPLALQPAARPVEELARDLFVVDGIEEAEETSVVAVSLEVLAVDLRRRPPHARAAPVGTEHRPLAVLEERILARIELVLEQQVERPDVDRVLLVDAIDDVEEVAERAGHGHLPYLEPRAGHGPRALPDPGPARPTF